MSASAKFPCVASNVTIAICRYRAQRWGTYLHLNGPSYAKMEIAQAFRVHSISSILSHICKVNKIINTASINISEKLINVSVHI